MIGGKDKKASKGEQPKAEEAKAEEAKVEETKAEETGAEAAETAAQDAEKPADAEAPKAEEKPSEPDWKDSYARLLADFDNFKKRTARDREDTYRFAEADILGDLLPTVDNLALALTHAKNADDEFAKGVKLVYESFLKALKDHGAEPFDSVGEELDPERMEAIATLPSEEVAEGKVSNEVKRGWMLKGKLLRAAQVVVSSGKANG